MDFHLVLTCACLLTLANARSTTSGDPLFTERHPIECDTGSCYQVKMNPTIIKSVCFHTSELSSTFEFNDKLFSYKGKVPPHSSLFETDGGTQAIFTCSNGNGLYGSISMENPLGKFETLFIEQRHNNDQIVVFLLDSDIPEDKGVQDTLDDHSTRDRFAPDPELFKKGASDSTTLARYSIKFYYTPQFAADTSDIASFIDQALAVVNLGYVNSQVPLEAYSLCKELATIDDQDDSSKMLRAFRDMKGSVSKLKGGADIAALLVKEFDSCGIAYVNTVVNAGSTISVTKKSCILGYYSLGHEIGHNIGLAHDPATSNNDNYPYGHGHLIQAGASSTGRRTILAYRADGHRERVNYYSNPAVIYPETKTPTGVKGISNNAALLMNNRFVLQSLGDGNKCDGSSGTSCDASNWPDLDHGLTCGDCKALINKMSSKYITCNDYCKSIDRSCSGAWEESDDSCKVQSTETCAHRFTYTSDAICECGPKVSGTSCDASNWPNLDHGLTCGDCKALINKMNSKYITCKDYCKSIDRSCSGAWEESDDSCKVQSTETCTHRFTYTSDAICECGPTLSGTICDASDWPDLDHGLTCGDCKALINKMSSKYITCKDYCKSIDRSCSGAWEESDDSCKVKSTETCTHRFTYTSDAICECGPTLPGTSCDASNWPDLDHGLTCGDCKALIKKMNSKYITCKDYCKSIDRSCSGAWEESGDSCKVQSTETCTHRFTYTSDAICECGPAISG